MCGDCILLVCITLVYVGRCVHEVCVCPGKPYYEVIIPTNMAISKVLVLMGIFIGPHEENSIYTILSDVF